MILEMVARTETHVWGSITRQCTPVVWSFVSDLEQDVLNLLIENYVKDQLLIETWELTDPPVLGSYRTRSRRSSRLR